MEADDSICLVSIIFIVAKKICLERMDLALISKAEQEAL